MKNTPFIAAAFLMAILSGCDRNVRDSKQQAESDGLPEAAGWKVEGDERAKILFDGARTFCEADGLQIAHVYEQDVLAVAQLRFARRLLGDSGPRSLAIPYALFGAYGRDGNNRPYVTVFVLNSNRETNQLVLCFESLDGEHVFVSYDLSLKEKDIEIVKQVFCNVDLVPWKELAALSAADSTAQGFPVHQRGKYPFPSEPVLVVGAAAIDRMQGMSNFVQLTRYDYPH